MILFSEAQQLITKKVSPLGTETIPLEQALNRILATSVTSNLNLPPFSNSAMDGYVFNSKDLNKNELTCIGSIAAGNEPSSTPITAGTCMEIMTGAPVPPCGDTVIPIENTSKNGDIIQIKQPVKATANVRLAGEDVTKNEILMPASTWLTAQHISMLAATGVAKITVQNRPKVALLTTGNEVVADLTQPLKQGQIYNSSLYYLQAVLPQLGVEIIHTEILEDNPVTAKKAILTALKKQPDIIITTGAVSMGKYDFIPPLLKELNGEILFHKVACRPGKPILVGQLPKNIWWLGLPGNPVSTMVGLRFLGSTLLRGLLNLPPEKPLTATLTTTAYSKAGFMHFQKARMYIENGELCVDVLQGQASFMLNPLLQSNAWATIPQNISQLNIGDKIEIYPLLWPEIQTNFHQTGVPKNAKQQTA